MNNTLQFDGDYELLKDLQALLVGQGIKADTQVLTSKETRLFYPEKDAEGLPIDRAENKTFVWMNVISTITEVAKVIVELMKKQGQLSITVGGKTRKITRKDSVGNVETILEESKGTRISLKIEV